MGNMVFEKDTVCTFKSISMQYKNKLIDLPQLTTINTNGSYMFLMKEIDVQGIADYSSLF